MWLSQELKLAGLYPPLIPNVIVFANASLVTIVVDNQGNQRQVDKFVANHCNGKGISLCGQHPCRQEYKEVVAQPCDEGQECRQENHKVFQDGTCRATATKRRGSGKNRNAKIAAGHTDRQTYRIPFLVPHRAHAIYPYNH